MTFLSSALPVLSPTLCGAELPSRVSPPQSFLAVNLGHAVFEIMTFDWSVLEATSYYTCLSVAGCNVDLFVLDTSLFLLLPAPCHTPSLAVHQIQSSLKVGFGFCSLLCCAV